MTHISLFQVVHSLKRFSWLNKYVCYCFFLDKLAIVIFFPPSLFRLPAKLFYFEIFTLFPDLLDSDKNTQNVCSAHTNYSRQIAVRFRSSFYRCVSTRIAAQIKVQFVFCITCNTTTTSLNLQQLKGCSLWTDAGTLGGGFCTHMVGVGLPLESHVTGLAMLLPWLSKPIGSLSLDTQSDLTAINQLKTRR